MDSNFTFSIKRLPNGDALLCDGGGAPIACNSQGKILVNQRGTPMTVDQIRAAHGKPPLGEERKPGLEEYHSLVEQIFMPRLNLRTMEIEFGGIPITEEEFENLNVTSVKDHGLKFRKGDLQSTVRAIARKSAYDPVYTELAALGVDGTDCLTDEEWDQIAILGLGLSDSYSKVVIQKWLLAAVERVMDPGCKVDYCLILKGEQGIGKSSFFRILAGDHFTDSLGGLDHIKDDLMIMHKNWICEWSEADQVFVGANKAEKIKRFISAQEDCFRAPYGRTTSTYKRRSLLVGTTNRDDWANDPTGNRRFPVLEPQGVDLEWLAENRTRIWARAVVERRRGARWWFSKEEEQQISIRAAAYAPEDPHAERMLEQLRACPGRWFSAQELAALALEWDAERIDKRNLNAVARSLHALRDPCVLSERRTHTPVNPSHGGKGTRRVWQYSSACTQCTQ